MSEEIETRQVIRPIFGRLTRNSLLLASSNIGGAFLSFGISILIARGLGQVGFGRWVFILAWASGLTMISEFGLNSLLTRDSARSPSSLNHLLITSLAIKLSFIAVLGTGIWLASPYLGLESETSMGLRCAVLIACTGVISASFTAIFRASHWMSPILWINIFGLSVQLFGFAWLLRMNRGVVALIQFMVVVNVLQVIAAILLWWGWVRRRGGKMYFSVSSVATMTYNAVPFALAGLVGALQIRSNAVLLGYIRGDAEVGMFGSAFRLAESAKLIPNGIFDAVFPVFAEEESNRNNRLAIYRKLDQIILWYAAIVAGVLVLFNETAIRIVFGDDFLPASSALFWLGIALFPTLHNAVVELYLYATGDEKYATKLGIVGVAVQICASVPLMFLYGSGGAAAGILCGVLAIWLPLRWRMKKRSS